MDRQTRRQFLENSMLATAAALSSAATPAVAGGADSRKSASPNEKLGAVVMGVNSMGTVHCNSFLNNPRTEILYICDPDEKVGRKQAEVVGKKQGRQPNCVKATGWCRGCRCITTWVSSDSWCCR